MLYTTVGLTEELFLNFIVALIKSNCAKRISYNNFLVIKKERSREGNFPLLGLSLSLSSSSILIYIFIYMFNNVLYEPQIQTMNRKKERSLISLGFSS